MSFFPALMREVTDTNYVERKPIGGSDNNYLRSTAERTPARSENHGQEKLM